MCFGGGVRGGVEAWVYFILIGLLVDDDLRISKQNILIFIMVGLEI